MILGPIFNLTINKSIHFYEIKKMDDRLYKKYKKNL